MNILAKCYSRYQEVALNTALKAYKAIGEALASDGCRALGKSLADERFHWAARCFVADMPVFPFTPSQFQKVIQVNDRYHRVCIELWEENYNDVVFRSAVANSLQDEEAEPCHS